MVSLDLISPFLTVSCPRQPRHQANQLSVPSPTTASELTSFTSPATPSSGQRHRRPSWPRGATPTLALAKLSTARTSRCSPPTMPPTHLSPMSKQSKRVRATLSITSSRCPMSSGLLPGQLTQCDCTDRDREIYNAAYKRWQRCRLKLGKSLLPSSKHGLHSVRFSKAAEPLRAHHFTNKIISNFRANQQPSSLPLQVYPSSRPPPTHPSRTHCKDISIIWGGGTASTHNSWTSGCLCCNLLWPSLM